MSHVRDTWTRPTADGGRIPISRHRHGRRWLAVWGGPDGKRYSHARAPRSDAAQHAAEMEVDAAMQRELSHERWPADPARAMSSSVWPTLRR